MPPLRPFVERAAERAALALASVSALGAVAGLGGGFSGWLDVATHGAPLWLAGGAAAWLLARLAARELPRRLAQTLGVVAVLAAAPVIWPEAMAPRSPKAPADAPHQLRLIQFNAWDLNADRPATIAWLLRERPDIIAMEEAQGDIMDVLRDKAGYHVTCQGGRPQWCTTAILSLEAPLAGGLDDAALPGEVMPLTRARFAASDGGDFTVVAAHFDWPTNPARQADQRWRVAALIAASGPHERMILAGDFNSTPWSFARRSDDEAWGMERRTRGLFSWPSPSLRLLGLGWPLAFLPIDHVYAGRGWRTVSVVRGPVVGSDHYPVLVTLALAPESGRRRP